MHHSCGFGHIYWRNPKWKTSFFVQCHAFDFHVALTKLWRCNKDYVNWIWIYFTYKVRQADTNTTKYSSTVFPHYCLKTRLSQVRKLSSFIKSLKIVMVLIVAKQWFLVTRLWMNQVLEVLRPRFRLSVNFKALFCDIRKTKSPLNHN